jgi:2-amino-4-hydroxy-6-hydroxymethyldihydropteridine diphosphokinase
MQSEPTDAVIGLGSNLGDRRRSLRDAVRAVSALGRVIGISSLYETDAVGPPQPRYLNAAIRLSTELGPHELLAELLAIEQSHGRERRERWSARVLDLDILWIRGVSLDLPRLRVPHPELERRVFALAPLVDVAPEARDPATSASYSEILAALDPKGVDRVPGTTAGRWLEGELGARPS